MAISLTNIATNVAGFSGATFSVTVPVGGVPAGSLIVVVNWEQGTATVGTAVNDTAGNSYSKIASLANGANGVASIWYAWNCLALVSGNTISYTVNNTNDSQAMSAFYATGVLATSDPLDAAVTKSASGTSAAPSLLSGTPSQSGELIVGAVGFAAASTTFTQDSADAAYQNFPVAVANATDLAGVGGGAVVNSGSGALTYAPAITSAPWVEFVVGFKAAGGAAPKVVILDKNSTSPWATPSDWNNANNKVEIVGPGGSGANGATRSTSGGGGGGGAYQSRTNLTLSGNNPFRVPAGGSGLTARFGNDGTTGANYFGAQFGGSTTTGTAGTAGSATQETGGTPPGTLGASFAGGAGGAGRSSTGARGGGGGGGAGGPLGAGNAGGSSPNAADGGSGGGGSNNGTIGQGTPSPTATNGGAGGTSGISGSTAGLGATTSAVATGGTLGAGGGGGATTVNLNGTVGSTGNTWDSTHGPGGGGGGGGAANPAGRAGGGANYGGGGGGGGSSGTSGGTSGSGAVGGDGLIVITYTPASLTITADAVTYGEAARSMTKDSLSAGEVTRSFVRDGMFAADLVRAGQFTYLSSLELLTLGLGIGLKAHNNSSGSPVATTLTGVTGTNSVLVLVATVNSSGTPAFTCSSSTLGSWGSALVQAGSAAANPIVAFTKACTSALTNEVVTLSCNNGMSFVTIDVFEVKGATTSSYLDPNVSLPATSGGPDPVTGIGTSNANDLIVAGFREFSTSSPTAGNVAGAAALAVSGADFQLVEYGIVTSTVSGASASQSTGAGDSNGCFAFAIKAAGSTVTVTCDVPLCGEVFRSLTNGDVVAGGELGRPTRVDVSSPSESGAKSQADAPTAGETTTTQRADAVITAEASASLRSDAAATAESLRSARIDLTVAPELLRLTVEDNSPSGELLSQLLHLVGDSAGTAELASAYRSDSVAVNETALSAIVGGSMPGEVVRGLAGDARTANEVLARSASDAIAATELLSQALTVTANGLASGELLATVRVDRQASAEARTAFSVDVHATAELSAYSGLDSIGVGELQRGIATSFLAVSEALRSALLDVVGGGEFRSVLYSEGVAVGELIVTQFGVTVDGTLIVELLSSALADGSTSAELFVQAVIRAIAKALDEARFVAVTQDASSKVATPTEAGEASATASDSARWTVTIGDTLP